MPALLDAPPVIPWDRFYLEERGLNRTGQHRLFVGPTQSGKTVLCRKEAALRDYVIVFGTKAVDASLDAYLIEGYKRIYHWPPTKKEIDQARSESGAVRFILWPKMKAREDLYKHRDEYIRCLDQAFIEGRWTIVADEGLWLAATNGLNLDKQLSAIAYGAASNQVSLYLCLQRPAGLSRVIWQSTMVAYVFHLGVTNDVRELASLGTYDPGDVKKVIQSLQRHEFLRLPCSAAGSWALSKVSAQAALPVKLP